MFIIQLIFFFLWYYFIFKFVLHKVKQLFNFFQSGINKPVDNLITCP